MKKPILLPCSAALFLLALPVHAANVTWTGGNFTWNQPDADSFDVTYNSGDDVFFGNTGVGAITVGAGVTPGTVNFNHSSGTYSFNGTAWNAGANALNITGAGTVQFGNMGNGTYHPTWGATNISGGGTLNYTRSPGFIGSNVSTITLNNGTLRLGADVTSTNNYTNPISVGAGGGAIQGQYTSVNALFIFTNNIWTSVH
jgi:hypothetical protein